MTPCRVIVAARAAGEIERAAAWWRAHRPRAPSLFLDELGVALEQLAAAPASGNTFPAKRVAGVRRLWLPKTRYHLYYTVDETARLVSVRALWHANRGRTPRL